ncbi:MAG: tetratricopeptide repeat protein [candidate division Zixibacteria bacterium]|nr:tetratricopeptide repeat protein [candidate division Zixibacteria bacterium]
MIKLMPKIICAFWAAGILLSSACGPKLPPEERFLNNYQTGHELMLNRKYERAIKHFRKAMKIQDSNPEVYRQMAVCFEKLNETDSAVVYYEGAIVFNPKDSDSYQRIGDIYYEQGDLHEAMTWYDRAKDLGYIQPRSYYRLGNVHYEWQRYEMAKQCYEFAIIADSTYADAYYGLGKIELAAGDTVKAEANFHKAAEAYSHSNSYYMLGTLYYKQQDSDRALKWFEAYLRLAPEGKYSLKAKDYRMKIMLEKKAGRQ